MEKGKRTVQSVGHSESIIIIISTLFLPEKPEETTILFTNMGHSKDDSTCLTNGDLANKPSFYFKLSAVEELLPSTLVTAVLLKVMRLNGGQEIHSL